MKLAILLLVSSFSVFANTADVNCSINQPIVIETTWGMTQFRQAQLDFWSVDKEGTSTTLNIQDNFGSGFAYFNRLWVERTRCMSESVCLNTDFSSFRGLSFEFPKEVFENESHFFTMRVRSNNNRRTYFANCRSNLR